MQTKREKLKKSDYIFIFSALTIPILQFLIFYVATNTSSILMAFQKVNEEGAYEFDGINTVKTALNLLFTDVDYLAVLKNSVVLYFMSNVVAIVISTFMAFCMWKKVRGFKFFSAILFLPSVIAGMVFVLIAKEMVNGYLPIAFNKDKIAEIFNEYGSGFEATMIYGIFLTLGSKLILLLGAMSSVDASVVEYGEIDGVNTWQQFRYIVFPHIWPTLISLYVIGLASLFMNQGLAIGFYGANTEHPTVQPFAAYLYVKVLNDWGATSNAFPIYSAMGLVMSIFVIALSLFGRRLMEKYGPSED